MHACVGMCANIHTCVRVCAHMCACVRICALVCACVHMCTHVFACVISDIKHPFQDFCEFTNHLYFTYLLLFILSCGIILFVYAQVTWKNLECAIA